MNNKKKLKRVLKQLPVNISITGLAILATVADRAGHMIIDLLCADKREGVVASFRRFDQLKDFDDYYEIIKNFVSSRESAKTLLWRLEQKGMIKKTRNRLALTSIGKRIVNSFSQKVKEVDWDGKWRIVTFDIPENRRGQRKWLYFNLIASDYKPLQKSVFLGKLPLDQELMREIIDRDLYKNIRIITVSDIDNDSLPV